MGNGRHSHRHELRLPHRVDLDVNGESRWAYTPIVWELARNGSKVTCEFVESVAGECFIRLRYDGMRFRDIYGVEPHDAVARSLDALDTQHEHGWRQVDDPG